jgi:hypothetical protein
MKNEQKELIRKFSISLSKESKEDLKQALVCIIPFLSLLIFMWAYSFICV